MKKRFATHITQPDGKRVYLSATTKAELEKKVLQAKMDIGAGLDLTDSTLFETYARLWHGVAKKNLAPTSMDGSLHTLEHIVIPFFAGRKLRDIKHMDILNYLNSIADYSGSVQSKAVGMLRSILTSAVDDALLQRSPMKASDKAVGKPQKQEEALTNDQVKALLRATYGTRAYLFCLLAVATGLRRGELLGLMWSDIDLEAGVLTVRHNKAFGIWDNDTEVSTSLKTDAAARTLPLNDYLISALRREKAQTNSLFVIHDAQGNSLTKASFRALWKIVEARTVSGTKKLGDRVSGSHDPNATVSLDFRCHPHQLRHTFITQLFEGDMDIKEVQRYAGHSKPDITLGVYTHYREQSRREATAEKARAAVDSMLA